jgi:predicted nucleotidyltransferase
MKDTTSLDPQTASLFTPQERQQVLNRLLAALQTDPRIVGVLIVGSGTAGFQDDYSDIDLSVVVESEGDVLSVFRESPGHGPG